MASNPTDTPHTEAHAPCILPRVTIKYCTQCKWMLRAAYFAQELLSTFNLALGEVSLQPATGGIFTVDIIHALPAAGEGKNYEQEQQASETPSADGGTSSHPTTATNSPAATVTTTTTRLWDRKTEGGFPEVKELKRRVRDVVEPGRNLGHVDRKSAGQGAEKPAVAAAPPPTSAPAAPAPAPAAAEPVVDEAGVKRNPDGSVCEDCN